MNILTMELIKAHLRLEATDTSEDTVLTSYAEAAEEACLHYIEQSIEDVFDEYGEVPASLMSACLHVMADLYKNREATTQYEPKINGITLMLLKPLVKLAK